MMHLTTHLAFFATGACLGALLASFMGQDKWRWLMAVPLGLITLWFYHNGIKEENLDGSFVWWGLTLSAEGLMAVYFGPLFILGPLSYIRFSQTAIEPED
tara:strand:+ start:289 stop:588 length:300 start_codon:yes stop_codon:yes gene_type:complete